MKRVRLKKVAVVEDSAAPQAKTIEEYRADQERGSWGQFFEGKSPPVDYTVEGSVEGVLKPIEGVPFGFWRTHRNGVKVPGFFQTSTVQKIVECDEGWVLTTLNSIYLLEIYDDKSTD